MTHLFLACVIAVSALAQSTPKAPAKATAPPRFEDYRVTEIFNGVLAAPILATAEQRMFRTRIRNGVLKGEGVKADGESSHFLTNPKTNFAGRYVVISWGCGSQCVVMVVVDAKTGIVYDPPLSGFGGSELQLPLDNLSEMEVRFRRDSSLMILRNACRDFQGRKSCGTYYFNWKDNRFSLVKFVYVNPLEGFNNSGRSGNSTSGELELPLHLRR